MNTGTGMLLLSSVPFNTTLRTSGPLGGQAGARGSSSPCCCPAGPLEDGSWPLVGDGLARSHRDKALLRAGQSQATGRRAPIPAKGPTPPLSLASPLAVLQDTGQMLEPAGQSHPSREQGNKTQALFWMGWGG